MAQLTFAQRLADAIRYAGTSAHALAKRLETPDSTVAAWLNKGTLPAGKAMVRLPGILGVDGHWLLTGEGEMVRQEPAVAVRVVSAVRRVLDMGYTRPDELDRVLATIDLIRRETGGGAADTPAGPQE